MSPIPTTSCPRSTTDQCKNLSDGCWSNAQYDALFEEQEKIVDPEERQAVVHDALGPVVRRGAVRSRWRIHRTSRPTATTWSPTSRRSRATTDT